MTLATLINRPCAIIRRTNTGTTDDLGNEIPSEAAVETVCEIQQRSRDEQDDQGELSETVWNVFLPAGTVIHNGDAIVVDGAEYELVGEPWAARNPRTQAESHLELTVKRTRGDEDIGS